MVIGSTLPHYGRSTVGNCAATIIAMLTGIENAVHDADISPPQLVILELYLVANTR